MDTEEQIKEKKFPIAIIVLISILLVVIIGLATSYIWYNSSISAVENIGTTKIVEISAGSSVQEMAKTLKENGLIKSETSFRIYSKINKVDNLQAGKYEFNTAMNVEQIIKKMQSGEVVKTDIAIMFPEGRNIRRIAQIIAENTNNTYDEAMQIFESKTYAKNLISKYWFLSDEILDDDIYYPLEGYLFPDTYIFKSADVSIDDIIEKMLSETDNVLSNYKDKINKTGYTVHKFISLASIVENEGMNTESRQGIAKVFFNRLEKNMSLGSDVTTYYAFKVDMGDRDLSLNELNTYNKYNTRGPNMQGMLPVGPISNVSKSSIEATLNPKNTNALYFVADKNGKVYFSKDANEHEQTINELIKQDLWYKYE